MILFSLLYYVHIATYLSDDNIRIHLTRQDDR